MRFHAFPVSCLLFFKPTESYTRPIGIHIRHRFEEAQEQVALHRIIHILRQLVAGDGLSDYHADSGGNSTVEKINEVPVSETFGSHVETVKRGQKMAAAKAGDERSVQELERENLDLKITNRAKDIVIDRMQKERKSFLINYWLPIARLDNSKRNPCKLNLRRKVKMVGQAMSKQVKQTRACEQLGTDASGRCGASRTRSKSTTNQRATQTGNPTRVSVRALLLSDTTSIDRSRRRC